MGKLKEFYHNEICENQINDIAYEEQKAIEEEFEYYFPKWVHKLYKS